LKFTVDGTNGWSQQVKVDTFEIHGAVESAVELSIDASGTGTVTAVP
jgi:hypothetical protein